MTRLNFQLPKQLGDVAPTPAETTLRSQQGLVGSFEVGGGVVGGISDVFFPAELDIADSINFLEDQVNFPNAGLKELILSDSLNFADFLKLGINYIDGGKGLRTDYYLPSFADSINNLSDSFRSGFVKKIIQAADTLYALTDSPNVVNCIVRYAAIADGLDLSDSFSWEYAEKYLSFSDRIEFFENAFLQGFGEDNTLSLTDTISIFFLDDSVNLQASYLQSFTDDLNNFADSLILPASPIAVQSYDTLQYNWNDSVATSFIMVIQVADVLSQLLDEVNTLIDTSVLPVVASDDLNNLLDALLGIQYGISLYIESLNNNDIIVLTDSLQLKFDHFLQTAEQLQQFLELLILFAGKTDFSDSLQPLTEQVQVVLNGTVGFSDDLNNLSDSFVLQMGPTGLSLTTADSLNNLSDSTAVNLRNPLLTLVAAESVNFIQDGFSETEGIIPGTIDVSRIRRYLGDLIN